MADRVVILGGGFAGLAVAGSLKRSPVEILIVDRQNHHLFQPLLYQVATGGLAPEDIAVPIRHVFRAQKNVKVLQAEVQQIDRRAKRVQTSVGQVPYDVLVVATGSEYNYFGKDDWKKEALSLKAIGDATRMRDQVLRAFEAAEFESDSARRRQLLTFVIVGAGPTGVELAGALAELSHKAIRDEFRNFDPASTEILLVEAGSRILAPFSEELSRKAERALHRLGVKVITGTAVKALDGSGVLLGERKIEAATVFWAAGVRATSIATGLGAETDSFGRVKVSSDLSLAMDPSVFVIGDAACVLGADGKPLPAVAPVAKQQGQHVGRVIQSRLAGMLAPKFQYVDKGNLATVGRRYAVAEVLGLHLAGLIAWWIWVVVHIFYLIDFKNRILVMTQWIWYYVTFHRGRRVISDVRRRSEKSS
ncbi:MAG: NAD(P)/FAD-dependent oxidoreductase [Bdellovibrionales bacterium]|nr:NAD(P)/FAD-dependent oxidoreductase [Bdellovibrionales bacterium]